MFIMSYGTFIMSAESTANADPNKEKEHAEQNNVGIAYQVAADLYMQENDITWSRFSIMVVANSIILAAIATAASPDDLLFILALLLPLAGFALCAVWWMMTNRGFKYHDSFRSDALHLEKKIFPERYLIGDRDCRPLHNAHRIGSSGPRARNFAHWVICVFFVLYAFALAQVVFSMPWCETLGVDCLVPVATDPRVP
jgi:hypothetical protein